MSFKIKVKAGNKERRKCMDKRMRISSQVAKIEKQHNCSKESQEQGHSVFSRALSW
jgi:hypothetical protein